MPAQITDQGLQIQTFEEVLEEVFDAARGSFGDEVATSVQSVFGRLFRMIAEFDAANQELLARVVAALDTGSATGVLLDRLVAMNGIRRYAQTRSRITSATFTGTSGTSIANGRRVRYGPNSSTWRVVDGPYTIGGGGTVVGVVEAVDAGPVEAPASALGDWTILDAVAGWTSFSNPEAAILGTNLETNPALRARFADAAFASSDGPLDGIRAAVRRVAGVTSVRVYQNTGIATDSDGIPAKAIYVVVDGSYDDDEVRAAIFSRLPALAETHGAVSGVVVDSEGDEQTILFDRVEVVEIHARITVTTSTSEQIYPEGGSDAIAAAALEWGEANSPVGGDVLPYRLVGVVHALGLDGIDDVVAEVSDDGSTWQTTKFAIGINQRAEFDAARIEVVEA